MVGSAIYDRLVDYTGGTFGKVSLAY
jgi:hypothetical protein